jgi:hypothetical protein
MHTVPTTWKVSTSEKSLTGTQLWSVWRAYKNVSGQLEGLLQVDMDPLSPADHKAAPRRPHQYEFTHLQSVQVWMNRQHNELPCKTGLPHNTERCDVPLSSTSSGQWRHCGPVKHRRIFYQYTRRHIPLKNTAMTASSLAIYIQLVRARRRLLVGLSFVSIVTERIHSYHLQLLLWCPLWVLSKFLSVNQTTVWRTITLWWPQWWHLFVVCNGTLSCTSLSKFSLFTSSSISTVQLSAQYAVKWLFSLTYLLNMHFKPTFLTAATFFICTWTMHHRRDAVNDVLYQFSAEISTGLPNAKCANSVWSMNSQQVQMTIFRTARPRGRNRGWVFRY